MSCSLYNNTCATIILLHVLIGIDTSLKNYTFSQFRWVWLEGGSNSDLEQALEVGGFGYPAMVGYNSRRNIYIVLRASFSESGLNEFLGDIVRQKGRTQSIRGDGLPAIEEVEPWDGKEGEVRCPSVVLYRRSKLHAAWKYMHVHVDSTHRLAGLLSKMIY